MSLGVPSQAVQSRADETLLVEESAHKDLSQSWSMGGRGEGSGQTSCQASLGESGSGRVVELRSTTFRRTRYDWLFSTLLFLFDSMTAKRQDKVLLQLYAWPSVLYHGRYSDVSSVETQDGKTTM